MILARAPLRISLGGGGTDLPSYYARFGGFILSAAINKYVYICVSRPAADRLLRVKYSKYEEVGHVDDVQHDLVRPALQMLGLHDNLEIVSMADVPDGTGLGSSGSYLVALLTALYDLTRQRVSTQALAEAACHIEIDLARHPVGKHDHYLAAFGGLSTLDIDTSGNVTVGSLNASRSMLDELKNRLLLFYTGIRRGSREILAEQDGDTRRGNKTVLDSLHETKEIGLKIRDALERGDMDCFGRLLDRHWLAKKQRSTRISDPQIERWYELGRATGALGGKIVGAGGGGFLMLYCPPEHKAAVRRALGADGLREIVYDFDFDGAKVMVNF